MSGKVSGAGKASEKTRLTIPLTRSTRGDAVATAPPLGKGSQRAANGRPWIGTFDSDDFVTEFFRLARHPEQAAARVAYRDWCEPPDALLDAAGSPRYPVDPHGPAPAIRRDAPWEGVGPIGVENGPPADRYAPDGVPEPAGTPAWFRKLYQPVHGRFHIVATELMCKQPYYPAISARRVRESGLIIRRMQPQGPDKPVRWQDWVSNGRGRGVWVEVADAAMRTSSAQGLMPVDPMNLTPAKPLAAALRARLELDGDQPLCIASSPTGALPGVQVPALASRNIRWGYLPLTSDEFEAADLGAEETWKQTRDRWTEEAHTALVDNFSERAAQVRRPLVEGWLARTAVLAEVPKDTRGPEVIFAPDYTREEASKRIIDAMVIIENPIFPWLVNRGSMKTALDTQVKKMSTAFFKHLWAQADDYPDSDTDWRDAALDRVRGEKHNDFKDYWTLLQRTNLTKAFATLVRWDFIEPYDDAKARLTEHAELDEAQRAFVDTLSAILLRRVRAMRAHLVGAVYQHLHDDGFIDLSDPVWTQDQDRRPIQSGRVWQELGPATLAAEIDNWIAAHQEYARAPREWRDMAFLKTNDPIWGLAMRWHRSFSEVERTLETFYAALTPAAEALEQALKAEVQKAQGIAGDLAQLKDGGLALDSQPERGLLVFPRVGVTQAELDAFAGTVTRPAPGAPLQAEGQVPEAFLGWSQTLVEHKKHQRQAVLLPRFGADSLYAVQAWARVSGHSDCEADQIVWSPRSEPFLIADVNDLLGSRPSQFSLPDLSKMLRDLARLPRTDAKPFAMVTTPANSGMAVGADASDTRREWGVAWICSFGIPVFTICAWVVFKIIFSLLITIPGFMWMLLLKFCIPAPQRK